MQEPAAPKDEVNRMAVLRGLQILDTPPEERFDRLTRLARQLLGTPIALVSLIDTNRQWFKSCQGLDARETPRSISFCGHAIHEDQAFIIPDALLDPRFVDNPLVTGAPHIRFYAGQPIKAPDGSRIGTLCVIDRKPHQLTELEKECLRDLAKLVENELNFMEFNQAVQVQQESAERLSLALAASNSSLWDTNLSTNIITMDLHWAELLGEEPKETVLPFQQLITRVCPEDVEALLKQIMAVIKGEQKDYHVVQRVRHRLGHWVWIESRGRVVSRDADGMALRMIGTNTDISERKRHEEAFANVSSFSHAMVEGADHMIITTDTKGLILSFNRAAEKHLGYRADELIGKSTPEVFHDYDEVVLHAHKLATEGIFVEPGFDTFIAKSRMHKEGEAHEWTYVRKSGSRFPVSLTVTALRDSNAEIYAYLGIASDISERKRAARHLQENEARLSAILENVLDGILTINEQGIIETCNKSAKQIFGYTIDEVKGKNFSMLMPQTHREEYENYLHSYLATGEKKLSA